MIDSLASRALQQGRNDAKAGCCSRLVTLRGDPDPRRLGYIFRTEKGSIQINRCEVVLDYLLYLLLLLRAAEGAEKLLEEEPARASP